MNAQHLSLSDSWMTPQDVIDRARRTLGVIDLDPASSFAGNNRVNAMLYFDEAMNGLEQTWCMRGTTWHIPKDGPTVVSPPNSIIPLSVFCNPPGGKFPKGHELGGQSKTKLFWQKLVAEREAGHIKHAIFLFFSLEGLSFCQDTSTCPVAASSPTDFYVCIPKYRLKFVPPPGVTAPGPTHANAIVYMPGTVNSVETFIREFNPLGVVMAKVVLA